MPKHCNDLVSKSIVLETFAELYWFDEDSLVVSKENIDKIYERLRQIGHCEKCRHWESDTGYCSEIADSNTHKCHFEPI